ncbi:MAG: HAD-IIB family hydrolase [Nitrospirae bacterium]|nr:HAD-IIB family hydrolase [Nitrospirota bacterium]
MVMEKLVIFTDLDGTLLDFAGYSFEMAIPSLQRVKEQDIPLIICSSKTRKEIEAYRKKLGNRHPFISENGGGIFIPKGYFPFDLSYPKHEIITGRNYHVIRLGAPYEDLRRALEELRREGFQVRGFGDMSIEELAQTAHMTPPEAKMAKQRDFDEPFLHTGPTYRLSRLLRAIHEKGFKFTQGRFYHILGNSNKGIAVSILIELYKQKFQDTGIVTVAIGDSPNDKPMLQRVDRPILVKKHDGSYEPTIKIPNLIRADGIGPEGWNRSIKKLLAAYGN